MNEYIRVDVVSSHSVDKYLSEGWEIIETTKVDTGLGEISARVEYHIGLPANILVGQLTKIIKDYEEQGLKRKLYEGVAKRFNEDASEYGTGDGHSTSSQTAKYMVTYEKVVNNQNVQVYKKYTQEELQEKYSHLEDIEF